MSTTSHLLARFLAHSESRRQAVEFIQTIFLDPQIDLNLRMVDWTDPAEKVIQEANFTLSQAQGPRSIPEYLADPVRRTFLLTMLLFLISSSSEFQPDQMGEWKPLQDVIDELLEKDHIRAEIDGYVVTGGGERMLIYYIHMVETA